MFSITSTKQFDPSWPVRGVLFNSATEAEAMALRLAKSLTGAIITVYLNGQPYARFTQVVSTQRTYLSN